jgi:WD40 repeat protein
MAPVEATGVSLDNWLTIEPQNASRLEQKEQMTNTSLSSLTWLADSQQLVLNQSNLIQIYRISPMSEVGQFEIVNGSQLVAANGSSKLAWGGPDGSVQVWYGDDKGELRSFNGITATITSLAFSIEGDELAAASSQGDLHVWEVTDGQDLLTLSLPYWLSNLSFSPDGTYLAGVDKEQFTIHILEKTSGKEVRSLQWTGTASPALYGAYFSPDWSKVAWVARGTIQLMDVASGQLLASLAHEDFVSGMTWSPDGQILASAAAGSYQGSMTPLIIIWDVNSGQAIQTLPVAEPVTSLEFSPDGRKLASLVSSGQLTLWAVSP